MKRLSVFIFALFLAIGCSVNPVTGKNELSLIPEAQEISMGQQNYEPSRQMQGGDYSVDPALTAYVQAVGNKLAAVSDRELPYEFEVLNSSVPNAWALPGGKIAINRGLLIELNSEAELAAVLGHEIVHAAAKHSVKGMQRGMLAQAGMLAVQIRAQGEDNANLIVGGASLGASLITQKYGRDAELESDRYGMIYMKRAGYNPQAAVELQKTFLRLSEGRRTDFISGLFASHPPSQKRVDLNKVTAQELGNEGFLGRDVYQQATASLRKNKPAYDKYDKALNALYKDNKPSAAKSLVNEAIRIQPNEAQFYSLLGEIALSENKLQEAQNYFEEAKVKNPEYFQTYLGLGITQQRLGSLQLAQNNLLNSIRLLPTATAYAALGDISAQSGNIDDAIKHYELAASSNTKLGQQSREKMARLDLPRNPGKYIATEVRMTNNGNIAIAVQNQSPIQVTSIGFELVALNSSGTAIAERWPLQSSRTLSANEVVVLPTQIGPLADATQLQLFQVRVTAAQAL